MCVTVASTDELRQDFSVLKFKEVTQQNCLGQTAMAARSSIDQLPPELLMEILSQLSWRQQLGVRRVSHQWLDAVDACLSHRQELNISGHLRLNTEKLLNLLQSMPALRRISIGELYFRTRSYIGGIISADQLCDSCPQLQEISLEFTLDDAGVETLLRRLPSLRSLHLEDIIAVGECLLSLPPAELQSLSLSHLSCPVSLYHMTRCRQLRNLDLSNAMVQSEDLAATVAAWSQLERLSVARCWELKGSWLPKLSSCPKLRDLDLSGTKVRSKDLAAMVAVCPQLERLSVAGCWELKGSWLPKLSSCPKLRDLDLSGTKVRSEELAAMVAVCPQLERLTVADCYDPTGAWLPELRHCPRLRDLDLSNTKVRSEELAAMVAVCPQLERLTVADCHDPTGAWLPELRHCPRLRDLDLSDTKVRSEELAAMVAVCPQLEQLLVARCWELKGSWLPKLSSCPKLRDLDLSGTKVRSEELAAVAAACPQLQRLSVAGCGDLTGAWLPELRHCPRLRDLDLSYYTEVRSEELAAMAAVCPQLERLLVEHCRWLTGR